MKKDKQYQPTESELEILQVLWKKGSGTVREVHEVFETQKETGYTTTLKTMQIMTDKGLLSRDTSSRTHIYFPELSRENCQQHFINKMLNGLFDGSAGRLVMGALDNKKIKQEELREIAEYLKQFEHPSS